MKVLALSDRVDEFLDTDSGVDSVRDVDLMISCGDLPFEYLERLVTVLNVPFLFVLGNHDRPILRASGDTSSAPEGGVNVHGRHRALSAPDGGLLLVVGFGGTKQCEGPGSGTSEMAILGSVFRMLPRLLWYRLRYGRAIDVLMTHAPPAGVHEGNDPCHRGFRVLRWIILWFRPTLALHGHVHPTYGVDVRPARLGPTRILNVYGSIRLEVKNARS